MCRTQQSLLEMSHIYSAVFLGLSLYLLFMYQFQNVSSAPSGGSNVDSHRGRPRNFARMAPRANQYPRLKQEIFSDFMDDDDLVEFSKRQTNDDYGHLRFGKRGDEFDDYGHMRFGRGGDK